MTTTQNLIAPIIMCGGKGTRLWPMSRSARPKQFLRLTGDLSLFQETLRRVSDGSIYSAPIVVTNNEYRFLVAEQAQEIGVALAAVVLEPVARNTAAAIAAGCLIAAGEAEGPLVHVLPSDHQLAGDKAYFTCVRHAAAAARAGHLVTFGITPTEPSTGFGYIEAGPEVGEGVRGVTRFVEKPDAANAARMLAAGGFYWNSGMFLFSTSSFLEECTRLAPEVAEAARGAVNRAVHDLDFLRLDAKAFARSPDISVDYAIFEKTERAAVVPADIAWSDLGSWDAVWKSNLQDGAGNVRRGPTTLDNTRASLVISEKLHVVASGLEDVAVVASEDAVYVGRLSAAQSVGALVKALQKNEETRVLTETHVTSYRPWGGYSSILNGERFQVKRLFVKPGRRLSLQQHHHRAEHWVVVRGTAEVQIGEEVRTLHENESAYIPLGALHRLSNPGKILLELIEVQTGSYLGEDDIVRLEDEFGRT